LEIRSKVRRLRHEYGMDLIVIDYLQLMQGGRSRLTEQNRQQEISEISRSLKALAREMDVPILALSQLSRNVEMRAEKKPQLSDLRESGSLEQDADIVMFLYRDEYYNRDDTSNENIAELIIAKNRNGPTTSIRLQFQKEILRFGDLTSVER
jgi:replicative DNA helicase